LPPSLLLSLLLLLLLLLLQSHRQDGSFHVFDDFREAYAWLRHNTHPETKVASWCASSVVYAHQVWLHAWCLLLSMGFGGVCEWHNTQLDSKFVGLWHVQGVAWMVVLVADRTARPPLHLHG
jgi:hypothetical protein